MGHTYRVGKSGCRMVTEFDSYCYDGVSAGIWVIHIDCANWSSDGTEELTVTVMVV